MNMLNRLMDAAQKNCEPQTQEALKVRLGVSRQSMYDWRAGNKTISDEHLARLIELAGGDPADAITVRREGAKSDHERAMWRSLARRLGAAAALAVVALLPQGNAHAAVTKVLAEQAQDICIMRSYASGVAALGGRCRPSPTRFRGLIPWSVRPAGQLASHVRTHAPPRIISGAFSSPWVHIAQGSRLPVMRLP